MAGQPALAAGAPHTGEMLGCAQGCKVLYGATGAGFVSEERNKKQRTTFPIINKAAAPSILMRQGGKTQRPGSGYTMGYNRDLALLLKRRKERETDRRGKAAQTGKPVQTSTSMALVEGVPHGPWPQMSEKCQGCRGPLLGGMGLFLRWVGDGVVLSQVRTFDSWVQI